VTGRLNDALKHTDLILADSHEQRQGCTNVECARENPAPRNCSGQRLLRVFNFVAHDGCKFQTNEAEADDTERVQNKTRIRGNTEIRRGYGGSEAKPNKDAETNQKAPSNEGAERANIVDPLADSQTNNVEHNQYGEESHRCREGEQFAVCESGVGGT